jgi:hypothetical protein
VVAIDGTRIAGSASGESTRFEEIVWEILAEAKATDEAEDELYGDDRGDELPEQLLTRAQQLLLKPPRRRSAAAAARPVAPSRRAWRHRLPNCRADAAVSRSRRRRW